MIVIGAVLLVLAALAVIVAVVTARDVNVHLSGFGVDSTTTALWVFCAGAVTMLALLLALSAFRRAARKSRARRRELKQLRSEETAAADNRSMREDERARDDVDLRDSRGAEDAADGRHAHVAAADDGRERRYVAGDDSY